MNALDVMISLALLMALALVVGAWLFGPELATAWRRARVRRQPFPAEWRQILRRRWPMFARLPTHLQLQLKKHVQVFLSEVPFIGCNGLVVTDEMRVLVAAQAVMLRLNRRAPTFGALRQVLLYPQAFVVDRLRTDAMGLVHETRNALAGESWQQGQLILSWEDVLAGAADQDDGRNVVMHEFAHQLDQAHGGANGAPWLGPRRDAQARWARTFSAEYRVLQARVARGESGVIDAYGATDPAELFAVVTEAFFEQPMALAAAHSALYKELKSYYRTDPLNW